MDTLSETLMALTFVMFLWMMIKMLQVMVAITSAGVTP